MADKFPPSRAPNTVDQSSFGPRAAVVGGFQLGVRHTFCSVESWAL